MRNFFRLIALSLTLMSGTAYSFAQSKAVEIGAGGSVMNYLRTTVTDFVQLENGNYRFNIEDKHLYGGGNLYVAGELKKWLYVDLQGTLGFARYRTDSGEKQGTSVLVGPGIQFRPFTKSEWIQPYARIGINYFGKSFKTRYSGDFDSDVTGEAQWETQDQWNKNLTEDKDRYFPATAGLGVIGWVSDRVGVGIQTDYNYDFAKKGKNFAQGTVRLLFRLGGNDKRKAIAARYYDEFPPEVQYVEKTVEVEKPVEKIVEVERIVEKYSDRILADLMENVTFEFDKDVITPESGATLDKVAEIIRQLGDRRFLIAGHTDAKGSAKYNLDLSARRAKAVFDALLDRGISESQMACRGFGESMAVVPESASESDRLGDRKVVIEIVTNQDLWKYLTE